MKTITIQHFQFQSWTSSVTSLSKKYHKSFSAQYLYTNYRFIYSFGIEHSLTIMTINKAQFIYLQIKYINIYQNNLQYLKSILETWCQRYNQIQQPWITLICSWQPHLLIHFTSWLRTTSRIHAIECVSNIKSWMASNCLTLNPIRTKLLWMRSPRRKHLINHAPFTLDGADIVPTLLVFYSSLLGVLIDETFSFNDHIIHLTWNCSNSGGKRAFVAMF